MNEYQKQAEDFLNATGTTIEIVYQYTGPHFQGEKEKRDVYRFTIRNARGEYSATFGASLRDTAINRICRDRWNITTEDAKTAGIYAKTSHEVYEKAKRIKPVKPTAYDILSCMTKYDPGTFEDFASDYGYNDRPLSEYPRVLQTYQNVVNEYRAMRRLFTTEQMEQLAEIN